jgi:tRNA(fMet)-specific endonuclease VapC
MASRMLLDTNILSDLVRHPQGRVAEKIAQVGEESICTSILVACELRFGAAKRGSKRLTAQLEAILSTLDVLPLEEPADRQYGDLRSRLEKLGMVIGPNDMLIAAHALALDAVLITDNVREFSRVPALKVENWPQEQVV